MRDTAHTISIAIQTILLIKTANQHSTHQSFFTSS
jgi:hypothetical protein